MKKIGIITALSLEGEQVSSLLGKPIKTDLYGHFSVCKYVINDKEFYCADCGVGEIASASCTQILLSVYNVELVLNYGFAGGYDGLKAGDGVIIGGLVHYDFDVSAVDGCEPCFYPDLFDSPVIKTDEKFVALAKKITDYKVGVLASGDKFVTDKSFKDEMYDKYGAVVYDMEAAGILITCKNLKIPTLVIKVVSDSGNADEYYSFKELVSRTKIKFAGFIKEIALAL